MRGRVHRWLTLGYSAGTGLDALARVAGVSIDSRAIRAGELFIASRKVTMDDHVLVPGERSSCGSGGEAQLSRYADPSAAAALRWRHLEALKHWARSTRILGRKNCGYRALSARHRRRSWRHCWAEAAGLEMRRKL